MSAFLAASKKAPSLASSFLQQERIANNFENNLALSLWGSSFSNIVAKPIPSLLLFSI